MKIQDIMKDISRCIEESTRLLQKPLKEGVDFVIDMPAENSTFNSYRKKYGGLSGGVYIFYLSENKKYSGNRFLR